MKLVLLFGLMAFVFGCSPDKIEENNTVNTVTVDYIIFGQVYGECLSDCRFLYLLNNEGLYADNSTDQLAETTFDDTSLAADLHNEALPLLSVPEEILNEDFEMTKGEFEIADVDYSISFIQNEVTVKRLSFDTVNEEDPDLNDYFNNLINVFEKLQN